MTITINHQCENENWIKVSEVNSPKTLVLGSFNPNQEYTCKDDKGNVKSVKIENSNNLVDYYYGRKRNRFWKTISKILGKDNSYFSDEKYGKQRKIDIMNQRFICLDIIKSLKITYLNSTGFENIVNMKILNGFEDKYLFVTKSEDIVVERVYNSEIIEYLKKTNSINKVIHTMGNNKLTIDGQNLKIIPINKYKLKDWEKFLEDILNVRKGEIEFVMESVSPSPQNWKDKGGKNLEQFLKEHLIL